MVFIFLSVLAGLNLGTVRKAEDPIRDTQTNPILYEQKKEEEKDGKKGPLLYHVKNNPRESFFIDPPFEKEKKSSSGEIVTEKAPDSKETAGWWEEQPTASQATAPVETAVEFQTGASSETIAESSSEPLPEAEKSRDSDAAQQPAAVSSAENAPSGKGDDAWW